MTVIRDKCFIMLFKINMASFLTLSFLVPCFQPTTGYKYSLRDDNEGKSRELDLRGTLRKTFAMEAAAASNQRSMVCSPISALLPLAKLSFGADGESLNELLAASGLRSQSEIPEDFNSLIRNLKYLPGTTLDIASRIFVHKNVLLRKKFVDDTSKVFKSSVEAEDFLNPTEAASRINKWVERETHGKIKDMVNSDLITPESSMILLNAVYFRGKWQYPFERITIEPFYTPIGEQKLPFMMRTGNYVYGASTSMDATLLEIPYKGSKASFVVVLPNKVNGLQVILEALILAPELLNEALREMNSTVVDVAIPRFKVETEINVQPLYEKVGVRTIFRKRSGLARITPERNLHISTAIQKSFIEVDEGSLTAKSPELDIKGLRYIKKQFYVNRPFLFTVVTKNEQIFSGIFVQQT